MPVTQEDIRKAIEDTERELEELKAAHRVMERLDGLAAKSDTKADAVTPTIGEFGVINLDEVELPGRTVKRGATLLEDIRGLIGRLGGQEFTVNHVEAVMKQMGKGSDAKHFKSRIATTIQKLAAEGLITRTHKGVGSAPHRYQVAKEVGAEKTEPATSPKGETEPEGPARSFINS